MVSPPTASVTVARRSAAAQAALAIPELIELILEHWAASTPNSRRNGELARLARVNKCLYWAAVARLYADLTLTFAGAGSQYPRAAASTALLVKSLASRPDFTILAQRAAVCLAAEAHLEAVLVVHRLVNLRAIALHLVDLPVTCLNASLLAGLPISLLLRSAFITAFRRAEFPQTSCSDCSASPCTVGHWTCASAFPAGVSWQRTLVSWEIVSGPSRLPACRPDRA